MARRLSGSPLTRPTLPGASLIALPPIPGQGLLLSSSSPAPATSSLLGAVSLLLLPPHHYPALCHRCYCHLTTTRRCATAAITTLSLVILLATSLLPCHCPHAPSSCGTKKAMRPATAASPTNVLLLLLRPQECMLLPPHEYPATPTSLMPCYCRLTNALLLLSPPHQSHATAASPMPCYCPPHPPAPHSPRAAP